MNTQTPIDIVLHCPACGLQHIDAPTPGWTNEPHRSHLCHGCGHIWRPADVPTNGVPAVKTKGKADSPIVALNGSRLTLRDVPAISDEALSQSIREVKESSRARRESDALNPDLLNARVGA